MAQTFRAKILFNTVIKSCVGNKSSSIIGNHSHWTARCISTKVDANNLANLRKQTGYGLSLCREALLENGNDLKAADEWLREQATKKGWQKAEKLQQRKAAEGLIGVLVEDNHAAMVELCCETDFVAQNDFFQQLIVNAAATALDHRKMIVQRGLDLGGSLTHFREVLLTHKLMEMKIPHCDETVQESLLQVVGRLGERIAFRRAITMTIDDNSVIGSYTHGPFTFNVDGCVMGKYAALVVVRPKDLNGKSEQLPSLATRLTQHIVGMNPKFISLDNANHTNEMDKSDVLLEQQYLMDDSITVKELLQRNNAFVVDFLRLECGNE